MESSLCRKPSPIPGTTARTFALSFARISSSLAPSFSSPIALRSGVQLGISRAISPNHWLKPQPLLIEVPILDPSSIRLLQPNTLVRFRGMIQDMLGNEFYVDAYKDGSVWRTNKFMDVSQFPMGSSSDM